MTRSEEYCQMLSRAYPGPGPQCPDSRGRGPGSAGNGGGVCLVLSDRKAHCEALVAAPGGPWGRGGTCLPGT